MYNEKIDLLSGMESEESNDGYLEPRYERRRENAPVACHPLSVLLCGKLIV